MRKPLVLAVALSLAACGAKQEPPPVEPNETTTPDSKRPKLEQRLESLRDRLGASLREVDDRLERAAKKIDDEVEAEPSESTKASVQALKASLDELNREIENLAASSQAEFDALELKLEDRLKVLNEKSKKLLRGDSKDDEDDEDGSDVITHE